MWTRKDPTAPFLPLEGLDLQLLDGSFNETGFRGVLVLLVLMQKSRLLLQDHLLQHLSLGSQKQLRVLAELLICRKPATCQIQDTLNRYTLHPGRFLLVALMHVTREVPSTSRSLGCSNDLPFQRGVRY